MKMETEAVPDTGDHRGVLHVILRWASTVPEVLASGHESGPVGCIWRRTDGIRELVFAVSRGTGTRQRFFVSLDIDGMRTDRWRLSRLGPTVWNLTPSLYVPGQIHAYVTLIGVPVPAPWE